MLKTKTPDTPVFDRVKLPITFDADKMAGEYHAMGLHDYIYYSMIVMQIPSPSDPTEGFEPSPAKDCPYIMGVIDHFRRHTKVTLARLLRMEPGAELKRHNDPMLGLEIENSVIRLTIPFLYNDGMRFYLNDRIVPMKPGECWYMKLTDEHWGFNGGTEERVSLTIDMVPNDWVRDLIADVH